MRNDTAEIHYGEQVPGYAKAQEQPTKPLSNEIMDRTQWALERSYKARGTLEQLRDRMFGPITVTAEGKSSGPSADSFASAWRGETSKLEDNLMAIEQLASELGSRF